MQIVMYLQPTALVSFLNGEKVEAYCDRHLGNMYEIRVTPDEVSLEPSKGMLSKGNFMIQKR